MWWPAYCDIWGYEVRKRAVKFQQVKTVNNVSYAEAVNTVQGQKGMEEGSRGLDDYSAMECKEFNSKWSRI